jgi:acyl dehydratase
MMEERKSVPLAQLVAMAGSFEAVSSWVEVTQPMIDAFAELTNDRQFIHVDADRAKAKTPFGGTIAHGFLTLSLISQMAYEVLPAPAEAVMSINYGFDKLRFLSPVRGGSRIRARFKLLEFTERRPGEMLSRHSVTVEIEGMDKPALAAEWLGIIVLGQQD